MAYESLPDHLSECCVPIKVNFSETDKTDITRFTTIKAGYRDFTLEFPDIVTDGSKELWGKTTFDQPTVSVKKSLEKRVRAETLLHELTHVAYDMGSLRKSSDGGEELIVDTMSQQLATLFRDNPELFKRIIEDLK